LIRKKSRKKLAILLILEILAFQEREAGLQQVRVVRWSGLHGSLLHRGPGHGTLDLQTWGKAGWLGSRTLKRVGRTTTEGGWRGGLKIWTSKHEVRARGRGWRGWRFEAVKVQVRG
jgi:hypothetical protein